MKTITFDCLGLLKSSLKRLFITLVTIHIVVFVASAQKTSTGSGAWNVAATWTPVGVPGTDDVVTIIAGHTVTVPANGICRHLHISGTVDITGTGVTLTISNNNNAGNTNGLLLNAGGTLDIGASNILYFSETQASGIVNNGGTIVSTGVNGVDGGTIRLNTNSGGEFRISGTAATTVYNLEFLWNASFRIETAGMRINGTVSIRDNNWSSSSSTHSPIYGPGATLSINNNGQGISGGPGPLNGALSKMWPVAAGTIGVTPGYPNNVTLMNIGTSVTGVTLPAPIGNVNVGWVPSGALSLNGTLRIGDGTTNGLASLHAVTSFNCGGIIVDHNSTLISPAAGVSFIDRGNFILQGATTGLFHNYGATLNMGGSATIGTPQIMSTTAASGILPLTNLTVSNGTYVRVDDDVTIGGILTLTSGYIGTTVANSLTVLNSATTSIVGGSATAYIDGPLSWNLPSTTSGNYVFPIGHLTGGAYLPLTMSSANSIAGTTATATAFNVNSNGIPGPTVTTISPTEYWSVSTSSPFSSGAQITVQRPSAVAPNNALASSGSSNGVYNAIGGSPNTGTPGIITNGGIGSGSPVFIVMVQAPLGVVKIGGTNAGLDASCNPTSGSIIAGGTGGTAPYTYSMTSAAGPWGGGTFGPLAKGSHGVWVRDNTNSVAFAWLEVLGSLLINGNNQDVDICNGETTTLSATNLLNSSATFTWTSVPAGAYPSTASINVTPTVPTTYTVSSTIYNPTGNRITNGSFETGVNGGSFTSDYIDRTGSGQYADTPDGNGYYMIADQGTDLCQWFSISGPANAPALSPQSGTFYLVGDGANAAENVWVQNVTGLTAGVTYQFSFYYAAASVSSPRAQIQTSFTNPASTPGTVTASNGSAWTQVTYLFTPSGTTTTITLRNLTTGIPGNDFYIDNIQLLPPCVMTESINVTLNCTLPVELLEFNAVRQGDGALLTWETLVEKNSSHFIVEKSVNGISFYPIGKVNAAGNSDGYLSYSLIDPSIDNGVTYYRLIQYDLNGDYTYSEIRAVTKNGISADVQIVPNPNNGTFMLLINQNGDSKTYVSIVNTLGQTVYERVEFLTNSLSIDISTLASGVYYLQVNTLEGTIVKKIVKE